MIYFIQIGLDGPIKIGRSEKPARRLADLQTSVPYELRLLGLAPGEGDEEWKIHREFRHLNIRGEWYQPAEEVMVFIRDLTRLSEPSYIEIPAGVGVGAVLSAICAPLEELGLRTKITGSNSWTLEIANEDGAQRITEGAMAMAELRKRAKALERRS